MPTSPLSPSPSTETSPQLSDEPDLTDLVTTPPISSVLVDDDQIVEQNVIGDQEMEDAIMASYDVQCGGDKDEISFWDIIAESHMRLENYNDQPFDQEMSVATSGLMSPPRPATDPVTSTPLAPSPDLSSHLPIGYEDLLGGTTLPVSPLPLLTQNQPLFSNVSNPSHCITFGLRQDGTAFPLSKPIIREDGLLLVGTEIEADPSLPNGEKNRIFVTNFLASGSPAHIAVKKEVRDLQWMGSYAAIAAIGKEIHVIHLRDLALGGPCRLQNPINTVHSDTIRELAVSPITDTHVLSGGFDETVVLTDLRYHGDPQAAAVIGKFDAHDVVSSVRWSLIHTQMSWTTDGGDFQIVDTRIRLPQLQMPLYSFVNVNALGGLFAHEYLNTFTVALGFERGHIAFVDLRMPRQSCCTSLIESKLSSVGEIRRSKTDKLSVFGRGGFSKSINSTASSLNHLTVYQPQCLKSYKTSGDFSYERGLYLAASDNMGIVTVYTDINFGASAVYNNNVAAW
ncbi:WD40/YVTN repeat-like-containing domain [Plasmopara halstedii]|uniref:WD40/YVTN repeat-like-containing domain n=1 Tax=Plasmopara halstedii TaxID=4781 RepID=A0A0N7L7U3_PLAHL|nr:WD40/YVTN repeat-like-containing domain [Plasmopara halstedii]CEG48035.1 WD40/YVTN repeat-like-containing domain [Plasmopara halstedii]|eukprot:XP_024584404.1 WD40/YVTN repeat-like-containing domain [Plasmopara halstedii]